MATVSLARLAAIIDDMPKRQRQAAVRGARSAAKRLVALTADAIADTSPYPPEDTGELKHSIRATNTKDGATVTVDAPHAPFMEWGTRPHRPPLGPLADWAYRKGIADDEEEAEEIAMAIAAKIARDGILPRHFMARALRELERQGIVKEEILAEFRKVGRAP